MILRLVHTQNIQKRTVSNKLQEKDFRLLQEVRQLVAASQKIKLKHGERKRATRRGPIKSNEGITTNVGDSPEQSK